MSLPVLFSLTSRLATGLLSQIGTLDFEWCVGHDFFGGQDLFADESQQRCIADTAVLVGLAQRYAIGVQRRFVNRTERIFLTYIGYPRLRPPLRLAGSPSKFAEYACNLSVAITGRHGADQLAVFHRGFVRDGAGQWLVVQPDFCTLAEASTAASSSFLPTAGIDVGCSAKLYMIPTEPCSARNGISTGAAVHDLIFDADAFVADVTGCWRATASARAATTASVRTMVLIRMARQLIGWLRYFPATIIHRAPSGSGECTRGSAAEGPPWYTSPSVAPVRVYTAAVISQYNNPDLGICYLRGTVLQVLVRRTRRFCHVRRQRRVRNLHTL